MTFTFTTFFSLRNNKGGTQLYSNPSSQLSETLGLIPSTTETKNKTTKESQSLERDPGSFLPCSPPIQNYA